MVSELRKRNSSLFGVLCMFSYINPGVVGTVRRRTSVPLSLPLAMLTGASDYAIAFILFGTYPSRAPIFSPRDLNVTLNSGGVGHNEIAQQNVIPGGHMLKHKRVVRRRGWEERLHK